MGLGPSSRRGGGSDISVHPGLNARRALANETGVGFGFPRGRGFHSSRSSRSRVRQAGILDLGLATPELVAFYEVILLILLGGAVIVLPLLIGWSVMRRQLFDVRFLINRALVYTLLTALLVALGLAAVFLFQSSPGLAARGSGGVGPGPRRLHCRDHPYVRSGSTLGAGGN